MSLKQLKKKFLAYINRDAFSNAHGYIDPLEYHSVFMTYASLFYVVANDKITMWSYISVICVGTGAFSADLICLISLVHYVQTGDIHLITESGTYVMLMTYQLIILYSVIKGKKYYTNFWQALKDDFGYNSMQGQKYRKLFLQNQRVTFKALIVVNILNCMVAIGMISSAFISLTISVYGQDQGAHRPMMYPFWFFDFDLHASPVYEVLFVISIFYTFLFAYCYIFDVKPAKTEAEEIYNSALIKRRMKEIIEIHISMFKLVEEYAAVCKNCLFYEQVITAPILCMTAYCFAEKLEAGEVKFLLCQLFIGTLLVSFVPNYLCDNLLVKVQSISDACWDMPFWNAGPEIRGYLVLIMQRSLRPLPINAPGLAEISLRTYSNIIVRAYSWFNMLRQASDRV